MSLFTKIRMALASFMQGRNGVDNLGLAALWMGLVCSLLGSLLGVGLFSLAGTALYIYSIWRMLSRNVYKRTMENRHYVGFINPIQTKVGQFFLRLKNRKEYKYFKCPQCKVLIRLKRGTGPKHICCPKCRHEFDQKA